jgi:hypothetical protein
MSNSSNEMKFAQKYMREWMRNEIMYYTQI